MRPEEELREELEWFEEWPEADEIDATCETKFDSDGYIDGIRYALGEAAGRNSLPNPDAINALLDRLREEYPDATVRVERSGYPPQLMDINVRVITGFDEVDEYQRICETIREYAREVEEEHGVDGMIYTHLEPRRD